MIFNILIDGYCNKGMIDKVFGLKDVMEKKGLVFDVYVYNSIVSGLRRLN